MTMESARPCLRLDHVVLAVPDLESGCAQFADLTGVMPAMGGSHPGLGTRNALVSFEGDSYLELIGPDTAQRMDGTIGALLATLTQWELLHWTLQGSDLETKRALLADEGLQPGRVRALSRRTPEGQQLAWHILGIHGDGSMPFLIDWQSTPHPSGTAPIVGALLSLDVTLPQANVFAPLIRKESAVRLQPGDSALKVRWRSAKGEHVLHTMHPRGFRF